MSEATPSISHALAAANDVAKSIAEHTGISAKCIGSVDGGYIVVTATLPDGREHTRKVFMYGGRYSEAGFLLGWCFHDWAKAA